MKKLVITMIMLVLSMNIMGQAGKKKFMVRRPAKKQIQITTGGQNPRVDKLIKQLDGMMKTIPGAKLAGKKDYSTFDQNIIEVVYNLPALKYNNFKADEYSYPEFINLLMVTTKRYSDTRGATYNMRCQGYQEFKFQSREFGDTVTIVPLDIDFYSGIYGYLFFISRGDFEITRVGFRVEGEKY